MLDVVMTLTAVMLLVTVTAILASRMPRDVRPWVWAGLAEYLVAGVAQLVFTRIVVQGGDTLGYSLDGLELAKFLDRNFNYAAPQLVNMLFQRENIFDDLGYGNGNTASMHAIVTFLIYFFQGSDYAAHMFVAGLSFFGALGIFAACHDAEPSIPWKRVFAATVMFPSVAFWTAAFHKEAFAIMGIGALLTGWRGLENRSLVKAGLMVPLGLVTLYYFRAPLLAPLSLGLVLFFVANRLKSSSGRRERIVVGPAYFMLGLLIFAGGIVLLTQLVPSLGAENLGESLAGRQRAWAGTVGGSTFATVDDDAPLTPGQQLVRIPYGLVNALFRPQLFDVHNVSTAISALEMSLITYFFVRVLRQSGLRGMFERIQRSPLLLMSFATTLTGCALVGLVTLNFGSLARYRVPILPFYGVLLSGLLPAAERSPSKQVRRTSAVAPRTPLAAPATKWQTNWPDRRTNA